MASLGYPLAIIIADHSNQNFENHLDPVALEQQRRRGWAGAAIRLHDPLLSTMREQEDKILLQRIRLELVQKSLESYTKKIDELRASSRRIDLLSNFLLGTGLALFLFLVGLHFVAASVATVTVLYLIYRAFYPAED